MAEKVRTVYQDKLVYKDREVDKCVPAELLQKETDSAKSLCDTHPVDSFQMDKDGKPKIVCAQ